MSDSGGNFGYGQMGPYETATEYTKFAFTIRQFLAEVRTVMLVQVKSCSNSGGVEPVGTVTVQPMVNMLDGQGNSTPHGTVFDLPYFRLQGGENGAVIMDPVAGDIGVALICDRDISAVQSTKAVANPGTYRMHDIADGLYVGGFLNKAPKAYVQFDGQGYLSLVDKDNHKIVFSSSGIAITGNVSVDGTITSTGDTTAGGISVKTHTHSDPQGGNTGPPNA